MRSRNLLLSTLIICISAFNTSYSQIRFQKTFGGTGDEEARAIIQTSDSGYLLAGSTTSFGNGGKDVFIIKTDSLGNKQWSKTFGGSLDDGANNLLEDNGSYYV